MIVAFGLIGGSAHAQHRDADVAPPNISFGKMPKNHSYVFRNGTKKFGNQYALRFEGLENNKYVMQRYERTKVNGPYDKLVGMWFFDLRGRLILRRSFFLGKLRSETEFRPYHCAFTTMTVCTHTRSYKKVGYRTLVQQKHYELALSGSVLTVVKNAKSNRIKQTRRLDEFGFPIEIREPSANGINDVVQLNRRK